MNEEILHVHGDPPGEKPKGVCCLIYENVNGLPNRMSGNSKLCRLQELSNSLQADLVAMNEHHINLGHKSNINGFGKMFRRGEAELRAVAAHNSHENVSRVQEGDTALLAYGSLLDHYGGAEKDESGLGW